MNKINFFPILLVVVTFLFVMSPKHTVHAHGTGQSLEKVVGEYLIDVGYDVLGALKPDESVRLDFNVFLNETGEVISFTDIWVRIAEGNKTVFAGGIHKARFGSTGMTFTFPEDGEYELNIRFQNESDSIVETTFELSVEGSDDNKRTEASGSFSFGIIVIGIMGTFG